MERKDIYQGDDTGAFGDSYLTINLILREGQILEISKAQLRVGGVCKVFENPTFPLSVNFTEQETSQLEESNQAYLALWDMQGRKKTCEGTIEIKANPRKV